MRARRAWSVAVLALVGACAAPADPPQGPATVTVTQPAASPTTAASWADVASVVDTGVPYVEVVGCGGSLSHGSGSLVGTDLVLTAAHVVDTARSVTLRTADGTVAGTVVAVAADDDVALVRAESPLPGHVFELAPEPPAVGSEVAAIGFPLGDDLAITDGIVSAQDRTGDEVVQLVLSVAVNLGNSGGPVVDRAGAQVGVVSAFGLDLANGERAEGRSYAVAANRALALIAEVSAGQAVPGPACTEDEGEIEPWGGDWSTPLFVLSDLSGPLATPLVSTVAQHGYDINHRAWADAFAAFTPQMQTRMDGLDRWSSGYGTTTWDVLTAVDASGDDAQASLSVVLRTTQDPAQADGMACTDRALTYHLQRLAERWHIDRVTEDARPTACDT